MIKYLNYEDWNRNRVFSIDIWTFDMNQNGRHRKIFWSRVDDTGRARIRRDQWKLNANTDGDKTMYINQAEETVDLRASSSSVFLDKKWKRVKWDQENYIDFFTSDKKWRKSIFVMDFASLLTQIDMHQSAYGSWKSQETLSRSQERTKKRQNLVHSSDLDKEYPSMCLHLDRSDAFRH